MRRPSSLKRASLRWTHWRFPPFLQSHALARPSAGSPSTFRLTSGMHLRSVRMSMCSLRVSTNHSMPQKAIIIQEERWLACYARAGATPSSRSGACGHATWLRSRRSRQLHLAHAGTGPRPAASSRAPLTCAIASSRRGGRTSRTKSASPFSTIPTSVTAPRPCAHTSLGQGSETTSNLACLRRSWSTDMAAEHKLPSSCSRTRLAPTTPPSRPRSLTKWSATRERLPPEGPQPNDIAAGGTAHA
mmetsp:Transcript_21113/g.62422  ORF Transcript_21113/g.62422 Transcript_21113/m.62422 type:complete len:245 (-) Transcript_21113:444-1178(-)